MTAYEKLKNMSIDELAEWIDRHCMFDDAPYWLWWDKNYCSKCEAITLDNEDGYKIEHAYCELNGHCRFFQNMDDIPDSKQIIQMWLKSEMDDEEIIRRDNEV